MCHFYTMYSIRTVVIEYGDLHDGSPAKPHLFTIPAGDESELQEEFLIRLPLVVVHDCYTNLERQFQFHFYLPLPSS